MYACFYFVVVVVVILVVVLCLGFVVMNLPCVKRHVLVSYTSSCDVVFGMTFLGLAASIDLGLF